MILRFCWTCYMSGTSKLFNSSFSPHSFCHFEKLSKISLFLSFICATAYLEGSFISKIKSYSKKLTVFFLFYNGSMLITATVLQQNTFKQYKTFLNLDWFEVLIFLLIVFFSCLKSFNNFPSYCFFITFRITRQ